MIILAMLLEGHGTSSRSVVCVCVGLSPTEGSFFFYARDTKFESG